MSTTLAVTISDFLNFPRRNILNPPSSILHPQSSILNPPSSILHPQSSILNPPSSILHPQSSILNPPSSILHPRSSILAFPRSISAVPRCKSSNLLNHRQRIPPRPHRQEHRMAMFATQDHDHNIFWPNG